MIRNILDSLSRSWARSTPTRSKRSAGSSRASKLDRNRPLRHLLSSPLSLLVLLSSFSLSACKAGDIGSSSSNAAVDNSVDDHAVIGDTECQVTCHADEDEGTVDFVRVCNGAQVSSGSFTDGRSCGQVAEQVSEPGDSFNESEQPVFDLQSGSI